MTNINAPDSGPVLGELRAIAKIALPLAATYLAEVAMTVTDRIIVGRLGTIELGAVGLAGDLMIEVLLVAGGVVSIVGVLVSQCIGAGKEHLIRRQVRQGLVVGTAIGVPAVVLCLNLPHLLAFTGQDPRVLSVSGEYVGAAAWFVLPGIWFIVLRQFLAALSRVRPVMVITLIAITLNAALTYSLVFGAFGLPALGVAGAGWATTIVSWGMFAALAWHIARATGLRDFEMFANLARIDLPICLRVLRLGLPVGGLVLLESGMFAAVTILMGVIGATALAANQIIISVTAMSFVIAISIGEATAIRVAFGSGRLDLAHVRRAGYLGLGLGIGVMVTAAVIYLTAPLILTGIFIDTGKPENRDVALLAVSLFAIAALFQISDSTQAIASRALRGLHDTMVPMWIAAVGYWGFGILGGYTLAFPLGFGAKGLWTGLAVGLTVTAILLTWRLFAVSNSPGRMRAVRSR